MCDKDEQFSESEGPQSPGAPNGIGWNKATVSTGMSYLGQQTKSSILRDILDLLSVGDFVLFRFITWVTAVW